MKPFDHGHREYHKAVLVGLEVAKQGVGNIPDYGRLLLDVDATSTILSLLTATSPLFSVILYSLYHFDIFGNVDTTIEIPFSSIMDWQIMRDYKLSSK